MAKTTTLYGVAWKPKGSSEWRMCRESFEDRHNAETVLRFFHDDWDGAKPVYRQYPDIAVCECRAIPAFAFSWLDGDDAE